LLDIPSLAFFTTYALLVLFWAEISYQARAVSTDGLRPSFFTINAVVYVVQVFLQSLRNLSLVFVGSWHILLDVLLPDCSMVGFVVEACSSYGNPI
jgi:hypothetical protein